MFSLKAKLPLAKWTYSGTVEKRSLGQASYDETIDSFPGQRGEMLLYRSNGQGSFCKLEVPGRDLGAVSGAFRWLGSALTDWAVRMGTAAASCREGRGLRGGRGGREGASAGLHCTSARSPSLHLTGCPHRDLFTWLPCQAHPPRPGQARIALPPRGTSRCARKHRSQEAALWLVDPNKGHLM